MKNKKFYLTIVLHFFSTSSWAIQPGKQTKNAPLKKSTDAEQPQEDTVKTLYATEIFLSSIGPVQYETLSRSEETGAVKREPNLITYGLNISGRQNLSPISAGISLLFRTSNRIQNDTQISKSGSTEFASSKSQIDFYSVGSGVFLSRSINESRCWYPSMGLFTEFSHINASTFDGSASFQKESNVEISTSKIFLYLNLGSEWILHFNEVPILFSINTAIPIRAWRLPSKFSSEQKSLDDSIQLKSAIGISAMLGAGLWL